MKSLLPLTLATFAAALLLSGCPDSRTPKVPPKAPEPKAAMNSPAAPAHGAPLHTPQANARTPA